MKTALVVGAGFAGAVAARELAEAGYKVLVIDKRAHIGGNAYDYVNEYGIRVHLYGPHLWHTSNDEVQAWASRFTEWVEYKHFVRALLPDGTTVPLPINRETLEKVFFEELRDRCDSWPPTAEMLEAFMETKRLQFETITNSEQHVQSSVGKQLSDLFFAPYTKKMWDLELKDLPASVAARIPTKMDDDKFYFPKDTHQFLPKDGYEQLFKNIFDHENITVSLGTSRQNLPQFGDQPKIILHKLKQRAGYTRAIPEWEDVEFDVIFTSEPIDEFYNFQLGELPWRSIKFHTESIPVPKMQDAPVVNFTHDGPFTRCTEWKQLPAHGDNPYCTTITIEEPCDYRENNMERYYPVKTSHVVDPNRELYKSYVALSKLEKNVHFIGRCGLYVYTDMGPCISSTLSSVRKYLKEQ